MTSTCTFCGKGELRDEARPVEYEYKGQTIVVEQPGRYCSSCGEAVLEPHHLRSTERQLTALRAKAEGLLGPDEIRTIRERLGLSQEAAGLRLGGGKKAFAKYEHGDVLVSRAMNNLLCLLAKDPRLLDDIEAPAA